MSTLVDTSVMPMIHLFLRREFGLAPTVVRGVPAGDVRRAGVVADHLDFLTDFLHHHHSGEDLHLWPLLLLRVPEELAPIVHLMEAQHEVMAGLLGEVGDLLPVLRSTGSGAEPLADLLEGLHTGLVEHLDAEEQQLLPIAARALTQAEWDHLGALAVEGRTKRALTIAFGMFQYEGDPVVLREMLAGAAPPARLLVPRLARRAFRRHALAVHGTVTPERASQGAASVR